MSMKLAVILAVVGAVATQVAANIGVALLLLSIAILALAVVIWQQNRRGFERLERLLADKAAEGQSVLEERQP